MDLSWEGAQIIMPGDSDKYFSEQQDVAIRIKATLTGTNISLTARIRNIVPARVPDAIRFGVQFTGLENNRRAKYAIREIYEYGKS